MKKNYEKELSELKLQYESFDGYKSISKNSEKTWKLFWDIVSVVFGLVCGYKIFIFTGNTIPGFGFFPLGIIFGLIAFKISAVFVHLFELCVSWLFYKLLKLRVSSDLPF